MFEKAGRTKHRGREEVKKTFCDPPSGHKYGFPCEIKPGQNYEDLLREKGYPEKDMELALKYSRFWTEEEEDEKP